MGLGRRLRRAFRRATRSVSRVFRRVGGALEDVGKIGLNVATLGAYGQYEAAKDAEKAAEKEQQALEQAQRNQAAEEAWQKEQQHMAGQIAGTQTGYNEYSGADYDFSDMLRSSDAEDEDILKKALKSRG